MSASNVAVYGGGVKEREFLEMLSALIGDYDKRVTSVSTGRGQRSVNEQLTRERILDVADLQAMPKGRAVVLASGARPTLITTQPWMTGPHAESVRASIAAHDPSAAAANIALLLFALSSGISGAEVWLAPMGLFVLALSQIFASTLQHGARVTLRVVGALLLYLPAALQIALQVGNARDGIYPVVFGLACLAGVAAGMLMQIRAYLALGVGFLVLDVVANLAHAGLRDHRVGFLVLSLAARQKGRRG